jgi:hypothetical protein
MTNTIAGALLFVGVFAAYNANGREIASFDSQPTKLAARELLLHRTLALNHAIGATPQLAERAAFVVARDGRYRSAYSPVPALLAAGIIWPAWRTGLIDLRAPLAPGVIAAVSASLLTALAVVFAFLTARTWLPLNRALLLAIGLGLGSGLWSTASQTLWGHETAILGLALAVLGLAAPAFTRHAGGAVAIGIGLGLAGTARPQLAPAIAVLIAAAFLVYGWKRAIVCAAIVGACATALVMTNLRWFGTVMGGAEILETLHASVHGIGGGSFNPWADGWAGLLVSPSRGLLVFTPVVLVAAAGTRDAITGGWTSPLRWCALAALAQYTLYSSYAVWWGGHTYGPRYMLDVLPLLLPLAACGLARLKRRLPMGLAAVALAWSIAVAALGAFTYPHEQWNIDPLDVDRHHERLWDWSDMQIARCWKAGTSPQNFNLFDRAAFRRDVP